MNVSRQPAAGQTEHQARRPGPGGGRGWRGWGAPDRSGREEANEWWTRAARSGRLGYEVE